MIKFYLIQLINRPLRWFGYSYQRMAEYNPETFEIIYHPLKLEKLKQN
jgi:hypothetical protein